MRQNDKSSSKYCEQILKQLSDPLFSIIEIYTNLKSDIDLCLSLLPVIVYFKDFNRLFSHFLPSKFKKSIYNQKDDHDEAGNSSFYDKEKVRKIMRHYFRINKQINLPLSLEAEAYLEEHGLREEVIQWRDNYCVIKN